MDKEPKKRRGLKDMFGLLPWLVDVDKDGRLDFSGPRGCKTPKRWGNAPESRENREFNKVRLAAARIAMEGAKERGIPFRTLGTIMAMLPIVDCSAEELAEFYFYHWANKGYPSHEKLEN